MSIVPQSLRIVISACDSLPWRRGEPPRTPVLLRPGPSWLECLAVYHGDGDDDDGSFVGDCYVLRFGEPSGLSGVPAWEGVEAVSRDDVIEGGWERIPLE